MNFEIRRMNESDMQEVMDIEAHTPSSPLTWNLLSQELSQPQAQIRVAVAEKSRLLGFIDVWVVADEIQLMHLGVLPSARREGVASSLLKKVISANPTAKRILLEVRDTNKSAISFYESQGFYVTGLRKAYYADGCDALTLEKNL